MRAVPLTLMPGEWYSGQLTLHLRPIRSAAKRATRLSSPSDRTGTWSMLIKDRLGHRAMHTPSMIGLIMMALRRGFEGKLRDICEAGSNGEIFGVWGGPAVLFRRFNWPCRRPPAC